MKTMINRRNLMKMACAAGVLAATPMTIKAATPLVTGPIQLPTPPYDINSVKFICDQLQKIYDRGVKSIDAEPASGNVIAKLKWQQAAQKCLDPYYEALNYALHFGLDEFSTEFNVKTVVSLAQTREMEIVPHRLADNVFAKILERVDVLPEWQVKEWIRKPGV